MLTPTITLVIQSYVSYPGVRAKPGVRVDGDSQVRPHFQAIEILFCQKQRIKEMKIHVMQFVGNKGLVVSSNI
jgi:hypothetical protein